jgi:hypothetical protein
MTTNNSSQTPIRALHLLSGGLDSQLAVCVLRAQGIEVQGLTYTSPFFGAGAGRRAAAQLGISLTVVDFTNEIMSLLRHPKHGFGSCMNPCIDCHALMLRRAGERMAALGCRFLSTGEVLNERPKSQNRRSLEIVARDSGYGANLLRPLSAKLLPETEPERQGWVDRSRLLALEGRSRKPQFALAASYGLKEYPTPAGGCLLTDPNFCVRLKDLRDHEGLDDVRRIALLRLGRHLRLAANVKIVVGRNAQDNAALEAAAADDIVLKTESVPGPTALLPATANAEQVRFGAAICARYGDCVAGQPVTIGVQSPNGASRIEVMPADRGPVDALKV